MAEKAVKHKLSQENWLQLDPDVIKVAVTDLEEKKIFEEGKDYWIRQNNVRAHRKGQIKDGQEVKIKVLEREKKAE